MSTAAERLRELRAKAGFSSARGAALAMGWHPTTYASHENGHRPLTERAARLYAAGFKVSPVYLMTGLDPDLEAGQQFPTQLRHLPLFDHGDVAEILDFAVRGAVGKGARSYAISDDRRELEAASFAFEISTNDMVNRPPTPGERSFNPGDIVVVSPRAPIGAGDFVLCRICDSETVVLRKWRPTFPDRASKLDLGSLMPLNADYLPIDVNAIKVTPIGRVARHIQRL